LLQNPLQFIVHHYAAIDKTKSEILTVSLNKSQKITPCTANGRYSGS